MRMIPRAVLTGLEIALPGIEVQRRVVALDALAQRERSLSIRAAEHLDATAQIRRPTEGRRGDQLGVDDDGTVRGVGGHNRLKSQAQSIARSADPSISVEVESMENVLAVRVPAQRGKPYSFGGKFFIREGASSQQAASLWMPTGRR